MIEPMYRYPRFYRQPAEFLARSPTPRGVVPPKPVVYAPDSQRNKPNGVTSAQSQPPI
jgi:hypothetical protein